MKRKRGNSEIVDSYLPEECWELAFKFFISDCDEYTSPHYLKSLSIISKEFLSITNRLRLSLTICTEAHPFLPRLLHRFTNLTSLNFTFPCNDVFSLRCGTVIADGLKNFFPKKITTLTTLICSKFYYLDSSELVLIAYCFPNLQLLDLNNCCCISKEGMTHLLRTCSNITHLNLTGCFGLDLLRHAMNFEVPKLKMLNLSKTFVDDETLYVISKNSSGLLQLLLEYCVVVTHKGVKHMVENCTQLRVINYRGCRRVDDNVVFSMVPSRPSLREIIGGRLSYYFSG